ncbi:MAG TPA: DUF2934 domain-containing protein [Steroidobacteraceae bacterium]|nr:DUF2934 domain-containing protein [Steroidobacteraceae bacterium]
MSVEQVRPPTAHPKRAVLSRHRTATALPAASLSHTAIELAGPERRQSMIAEAAYHLAQRRGFEPGYELDDWLTAEAEVDSALTIGLPAGK